MNKNVKILVCCHKKDVMATEEPYFPIHVGKVLSQEELGIAGDNTGDNISDKNRSYCELTGMYWAWKNLKNVDIIGLCHYRRYFDFHEQYSPILPHKILPSSVFDKLDLSVPESIIHSVESGDVVVSKPLSFTYSVAIDYCERYVSDDYRVMEQIVKQTQPENYKRAFYEVMISGCQLSPYNMFLMRWDDFENYCSWLFTLLAAIEKATSIDYYNAMQHRVYGFMAERLLDVWLVANKKRMIGKTVLKIEDNPCPDHVWKPWRFMISKCYRDLLNKFVPKTPYERWHVPDEKPYYMS